MRRRLTRSATVLLVVAGMSLAAAPAWAHPHQIDTNHDGVINEEDVKLANSQNHGPFENGVSCGGDPAAYGLETAHHGPDAGKPGKADDGCYQTTGGVPPGQDVENPVIR
jgi:hypothetical protein